MFKKFYDYNVYEDGKVYSNKTKKFLTPDVTKHGYLQISLYINKKPFRIKVHRLVCHLFNGMELKKENTVDHIDGNKLNNHYSNLECVSIYENNRRARINGQNPLDKENNGRANPCFKQNGNLYYSWEIAEKYNVKEETIRTYKSKKDKLKYTNDFFKKNNIEIIEN